MSSQGLLLETEADAPVVRGVKVLGTDSKNNREYPKEVMERALKLYDGAPVNIDHQADGKPRKYEDRFGRIVNPRMESDGIYADLIYNPQHPLAESFTWWAKHDPKNVGLSHNAQAKTSMTTEGVEVIDEIVRVDSVDLVAEPATTTGLLECIMEARKVAVEAKAPVRDLTLDFDKITDLVDSDRLPQAKQALSSLKREVASQSKKSSSADPSEFNRLFRDAESLLSKGEAEQKKSGGIKPETFNDFIDTIGEAQNYYSNMRMYMRKESVKESSFKKKDIVGFLHTLDSLCQAAAIYYSGAGIGPSAFQKKAAVDTARDIERQLSRPEFDAAAEAAYMANAKRDIGNFANIIKSGKKPNKSVENITRNTIRALTSGVKMSSKMEGESSNTKRKESSVKEASKPSDIINVLRGMRKNLDTIEYASRPGEKGSMQADAGSGYLNSVLKNNISGLEAGLNSPEMKALKSAGIATSSVIEPFNQVITKAKSGKQVPKSLCKTCQNLIGYLETATVNKKWKKESAVKEAVPFEAPIGTFAYVKVPINSKADIGKWRAAAKKEGATRISVEKYKDSGSSKNFLIEKAYDKKGNIVGSMFEKSDGSFEGAIYKGPTDKDIDTMSKGDPKLKSKLTQFFGRGRKEAVMSKRKKEDLVIPKPDVKTEDDSIRNEIESILGDDKMESDEKIDRIMACMMPKAEGDEPSAFDEDDTEMDGSSSDIVKMNSEGDDEETEEGDLVIKHDDDDDVEKPTEESLRRRQNPALKKLLEEVDAYRARDRREKLVQEARQVCEKAGLPKYSITGDFLGILADSGKRVWKNIIEDRRKVIFRGSSPVSTGTVDGKLSVDSLVKALTN